jgi:hypothetical protein
MVEKRRQAKINKSSAKKGKKHAGRKASEKSAGRKSTGKASPSLLDSGSEDEFTGLAGESEEVRAYDGNGSSGSAEPKGFWRQAQRLKWEKFPWVEGKKITIKTQVLILSRTQCQCVRTAVTTCQSHTYVAFCSVQRHHVCLPLLCLRVLQRIVVNAHDFRHAARTGGVQPVGELDYSGERAQMPLK